MSSLDVVEICAGAGGQSLGLHLAGFKHRAAIEIDPTAAATLRTNFNRLAAEGHGHPPKIAVGDVADPSAWNPEDYQGVSLLAGGVPCPPFSIAGRQKGASDERDLFAWAAVELAQRMQPRAIMLENVRGLSMPRFDGYRERVLDHLDNLGYEAHWKLLEARNYGVVQLRPRTVLVALKQGTGPFNWPQLTPATETVGSLLLDLMGENGWHGADAWAARANTIAPTIVGGSKKHGGADLGPTRAKKAWAALGVDGLGIADAAPGPGAPTDFMPKLTTPMVARIQGWVGPDYAWHFEGLKTARYRQIGNAFPPPVARAVGGSIASALTEKATHLDLAGAARLVARDDVYRVLKAGSRFMTEREIFEAADARLTISQVRNRIAHLRQDFVIDTILDAGEPRYRIGDWKAFVGQEMHERHDAFAEARRRSKVS